VVHLWHMKSITTKSGEGSIRKLTKIAGGSSYAITLPIEVVRRWGWKDRQKLELFVDERTKTIHVRDAKK
jgi:bifunctional DNA-binding transcriptional regulator/antitoxin component of YhaV-PrlF toxin-antitoxin module